MTMLRRFSVLLAVFGLCVYGLGGHTFAGGKGGVNVGDKAPEFEAKDEQGKTWKSTDHVGKKIIVVYFYPADFTGGCTKQACGFRDDLGKLKDVNVEVVGVSGDSVETHGKFKKAEKLNFTLLSDSKGELAKKFGVPTSNGGKASAVIDGEKVSFVRDITIQRWTFVIDMNGKIAHKDTKVNFAQDSKNILDAVKKLKSE
jgi:peroxiredoxin Q/BCP